MLYLILRTSQEEMMYQHGVATELKVYWHGVATELKVHWHGVVTRINCTSRTEIYLKEHGGG